jgi:hypothetical protein
LEQIIDNEDDYLKLFSNAKESDILGEASPVYWQNPDSPDLIYEKNPEAKFIFSLRNPITRIVSSYTHSRASGFNSQTLSETIHRRDTFSEQEKQEKKMIISKSFKKWIDLFGKANIKFLIFEEWTKEPKMAIQEILEFLKIENYTLNEKQFSAFNASISTVPRGKVAKSFLTNKTLAEIVGKTMPKKIKEISKKKVLSKAEEKPVLSQSDRKYLVNWFENDIAELKKIIGRDLPWQDFKNNI